MQDWVYHEVLPSIRKTGGFAAPPLGIDNDPIIMALGQIHAMRVKEIEMDARISEVEKRQDEFEAKQKAVADTLLALPAPTIEVRDLTTREKCREGIELLASLSGTSHQDWWRKAYATYNKVRNTNVTVTSENKKMSKLEYVDKYGSIDTLHGIIYKMVEEVKANLSV